MLGRRPSVVAKQEENINLGLLPLLQGTSTSNSPITSARNSIISYATSSVSLSSSSGSGSDSDSESMDESSGYVSDKTLKNRSSSSVGSSKRDSKLLRGRKTLVQLYLKLGGVRVGCAILCLLVAMLVIPYSVQRFIVWRKRSVSWVFSPIMEIERPCPAPQYSTLGQADAGKDLKICLTTLTDEKSKEAVSSLRKAIRWRNYDNILDLTWDSKLKYAEKHGYYLHDGSVDVDISRPAQWSKIKAAQYLLEEENCDWVLWHDADTLFMNTDVRIQDFLPSDPNQDLLVTVDDPNPGYNSGSWLIKNSEWGRQFLQDWWNMKSYVRLPGQSLSGDNDAFKALLASYSKEEFETHVGVPPRCTMNAFAKFLRPEESQAMTEEDLKVQPWYLSENFYHKGDFLVHVPGYNNKFGTLEMLMKEIQ